MVEATNNNERRPDYARPPVVETIVGVQFERLPSLKNAHLGAFWRSLDRTEWISVDDAPPILSQFEQFAKTARWGKGLQLHLTQDPATRVQFKAEDGIRMIQVQNGRLHYNWLGKGGAEYPRYEKVRSGFAAVLQSFTDYIAGESLGELRPNQWEVTYLNHITQGTVWKTPQDWNFFKPLAGLPTIPDLVEGESFGGTWHFVIPQNRGRLHIEWKHAKGNESDEEELVVLTLTARGPIPQGENWRELLFSSLDLGRDTIVRTFRALMNDSANQTWGLQDGND